MIFTETALKGAFILEIKKIEDERGFFGRSWCQKEFEDHGLVSSIVQTNVSFNKYKATLRGIHYQAAPYEETKLVRCTRGSIFDVIVDLRKESATYKSWIGVELNSSNYKLLYVPKNFGHAYITLEDDTEVTYQVSEFYAPGAEKGIRWNDPNIGIEWPIVPEIISEKDQIQPLFGG